MVLIVLENLKTDIIVVMQHLLYFGMLDPAIERYHSMQRNFYDHFKPSFKNALTGLVFILLPMSIYGYLIKTSRDNKEQQFRSGLVAYKDRIKKFV
ncbi:hypothetical protein NQ317_007476 [Molorchus minor]|uniref:NADH dehydrogenase [ubiquinone] 1 beta subcomplex subunit 4 n=1 Tax=Molorchus minor TaxID=1323400 RepID=A0ABQ9K1N5_9CUCU|nr:hypothetical protein NQ317_007476 [Molorchus minor]